MGALSTLFGGSPEYEAPEPTPMPQREAESEPESASVRDAERRKNRARSGGVKSTLLSNSLGKTGGATSGNPGLLGRSIS